MRLVLLSHYYAPEVGPPQRRWASIIPALVEAGCDVTVVAPVAHYPSGRAAARTRSTAAPAVEDGTRLGTGTGSHGERVVRVPYVPYSGSRRGRLLDQLVAAACSVVPAVRHRPDVVVATAPALPTLVAGAVVARLCGARFVVEIRDAWPDLLTDAEVGPPWLRRFAAGVITGCQRQADVVVSVSERFAATLRSRGIRHVVHIRNGVDLRRTPLLPPPPPSRERLEVFYVGTVGESQAVHRAVEAVAALPPGTVRLTVVGDGAGMADLKRAAARLVTPEAVRIVGTVAPGGVRALLTEADTLLVTLRAWPAFEQTVPSKLYEALASGRHVSAAVRGEAADIVRAAGAGDVVEPEDPMALAKLWAELHEDRARLAVSDTGRRWAAAHAEQAALAARFVAVIRSLPPGHRGSRPWRTRFA